jgi:diguanylate cyclase (GGDEF)-like protein
VAGSSLSVVAIEDLRGRAAFMRTVRWCGAVFVLLQFVAYRPPPGMRPPFPMLPAGLLTAGLLVGVNLVSLRWSRQTDPRRLARLGLAELVADTVIVLAIVGTFAFDRPSRWALLVFPVLEGAVRAELRGAMATWAGVAGGYLAGELIAWRPVDAAAVSPSWLAYRLGILFLVACITGHLARHLVLQRRESDRRAALLGVVAAASRRMTTLDTDEIAELVADTARELGFPAAVVQAADGGNGEEWTVMRVDGRTDGNDWDAWLAGVSALARRRRDTVVVDRGGSRLIGCPIWTDGEIGGVLAVLSAQPWADVRRGAEFEALELLAGQASAGFGNARRYAEREAVERQLTHHAFHDALTGLPNRTLFRERLEHALARAGRDDAIVAVLFLDLDGFKTVNDSLGHEIGDELLVAVASRLRSCLRPGDTAARLGGDEFTVLLEQLTASDDALLVACRILDRLQQPFRLAGRDLQVSGSIGVAVAGIAGNEGRGPSELLRQADLAMYRAKETGRNRVARYQQELDSIAMRRFQLRNELHRAFDRAEFSLRYQPFVELASGAIIGLEALVRWEHPERGTILPSEFVPLAKETGLIIPLGRWVLEEASRQVLAWQRELPAAITLRLSVNLSAEQFRQADLVEQVSEILSRSGFDPRYLTLEITEGALNGDPESVRRRVGDLERIGVQLAIDDFGRGQSSLGYLRRLPVAMLKIDKSFVDGLIDGEAGEAIVGSVIALARALGIRSAAEGVEHAEQVERLRSLGCETAQGYYLYRPLPSDEIRSLLSALGSTSR